MKHKQENHNILFITEWLFFTCLIFPGSHKSSGGSNPQLLLLKCKLEPDVWRMECSFSFETCVCVCVSGVQMYVCNREHYGLLPVPLKAQQNVEDERENFIHTITEALSECP